MQVFKQHGLKVFENKVLREICVTEGTGKDVLVHNRKVQVHVQLQMCRHTAKHVQLQMCRHTAKHVQLQMCAHTAEHVQLQMCSHTAEHKCSYDVHSYC